MKKTKLMRNKTTFAIALLLAIVVLLSNISVATNAQNASYKTKTTYPVIGAMPNPVGVGQETLLWLGISDSLNFQWEGWVGLTVTVKKPDGTTETLGPFKTDSTGGTGTVYVPNQVGNYTLQTHFPAQWYNWTGATVDAGRTGDFWYEESSSSEYTLFVTDQPAQYYPGVPLPTEYWSRPIDAQNREWSIIAGNWLKHNNGMPQYHPDNNAPGTPHVLWRQPITYGGLAGDYGSIAYELGDAYEGKFFGSIIIDGILFYNRDRTTGGSSTEQQVVAKNLHTAEELWARTLGSNERLAFGQMLYWDTYNMHGIFPYLWTTTGTTWKAYDAYTGRWIYTMTNVPADANVYGPTYGEHGEILRLTIDIARGWMSMWNSSQIPALYGSMQYVLPTEFYYGSWRPEGKTVNASNTGYMWNVTLPSVPFPPNVAVTRAVLVLDDRVVGSNVAWDKLRTDEDKVVLWAISTETGQEGRLIFNTTWNAPSGDLSFALGPISLEDGIFTVSAKETRQYYGFNIDTGVQVWGPTESAPYLDMYTIQHSSWQRELVANGTLFTAGYGGILNAYDIKTGEKLWTYDVTDIYSEILWSNSWPMQIMLAADGKIYYSHCEHSPVNPYPRGAPYVCLDMATGEEIWRIDGAFRGSWSGGDSIIGDGIIATYDTYDGCIYAIGRGPTKTTVSAPTTSIKLGESLVISGTVMDNSPGTEAENIKLRFPNGVPAVSDAIMSYWTLYLYKQFPKPTNAAGVEIALNVVDSNGNNREIGTTTTSDGYFSFTWKPDIEGDYTVYASFAGSESYWPSQAMTSFTVNPTTATPAPTAGPQSSLATTGDLMMYLAIGVVAIIIAIAIVGFLLLKKRP